MPSEQKQITGEHVREAAKRWDEDPGLRGFRNGTRYEVKIGRKRYPPKAIASIANELAGNGELYPADFGGAWEGYWHTQLEKAGYKPKQKADHAEPLARAKPTMAVDTIFDILNSGRFAKCARAFLVTGRPGREAINREHVRNNRSGDWKFSVERRRAATGDALFFLLSSQDGGYPRQLLGGLIKSIEQNKDGSIRFHVDRFSEFPQIESKLRAFLGGKIPAQGDNVLTVLDGEVKQSKPSRGAKDIDDEQEFPEGEERRRFKEHVRRERDPRVVRLAKELSLASEKRLECEACGFDFAEKYGSDGHGYIEGHHTTPLHQMKKGHKTKIGDIALVCSNCHRMLHRIKPLLKVEELIERLDRARA